MKKLSIITSMLISSFIIGCGSNNNSSNNKSSNNSNNLEKNVTIANSTLKLAPSTNMNINNKNAYTFSDLGIVSPVAFPKAEKIEDSNESNVSKVVANIFKNKTNLYTVSNAKVIKKPFTSMDGKLAVLFKFNPKLKFDTTVAVTNYLTLLALPNNGLDLLKQGLKPIPEISGDIAYYDSMGNRILDINKEFNSTDTSVDVYLMFKDINLTDGNYKLYMYDYNGDYSVKDIKIDNKKSNISVAMNKISSFVIAKSDDIQKINETLNLELPVDLKVGIVALDKNNKVVGVGELKHMFNNTAISADVYAIKQPVKYIYVSYFLKNGKKEVTNLNDLTMNDFNTNKYPLDFSKLSQNDKNILFKIKENQSYAFNWNELSYFIQPEKLMISQDSNETYNKQVKSFLENYIKTGNCDNNLQKEYNSTYENLVVSQKICNENKLLLTTKTLSGDDHINKTISIIKANDNEYNINYQENIPNHEKEKTSYTLFIKPYGRIIKNANENYSYTSNDISYKASSIFKEKLNYTGDNNYIYTYTENYLSNEKDEANQTIPDILNYDVTGNAKIHYNNETNSSVLLQHTYEIFNLKSNKENFTINGKNFVYTYLPEKEKTFVNTHSIDEIVNTAQPVTYKSNKITIGNKTVKFISIPNTKSATFNVEENVTSYTTYQNFANIKLPEINSSSLENKDGMYDSNLTFTIKDLKNNNLISFSINNANININNKKLSILLIPNKTKLAVYQEGLNLSKIKSGETKIANIKKELVNTDLEFNINSLINDLSNNSEAIKTTLNDLNKYLTQSKQYKVTLKIDTKLPLQINTVSGVVKINHINSILNKAVIKEKGLAKIVYDLNQEANCSINFRDGNKENLESCSGEIEHKYQKPGVYVPIFYANGKEVNSSEKSIVIVENNDTKYWDGYVSSLNNYVESNEKIDDFYKNGTLYISPKLSEKDYYWTNFVYVNINAFKNINANNFILTAKFKNSEDDGGLSAYDASLRIYIDDGESIGASLMGESWAQEYTHIWAGNSHADDLSELILDLNNYKTIKYVVKDNNFTLYSDGKKLYTLPFNDTFGKIVGISVSFKGSGTLDNVNIYNENNESVYNNDF